MWSLIIIDVSNDRFQSAHSTAPAEDYLLSLGITGRTNNEDFSHLRPNFKLQDAFGDPCAFQDARMQEPRPRRLLNWFAARTAISEGKSKLSLLPP